MAVLYITFELKPSFKAELDNMRSDTLHPFVFASDVYYSIQPDSLVYVAFTHGHPWFQLKACRKSLPKFLYVSCLWLRSEEEKYFISRLY